MDGSETIHPYQEELQLLDQVLRTLAETDDGLLGDLQAEILDRAERMRAICANWRDAFYPVSDRIRFESGNPQSRVLAEFSLERIAATLSFVSSASNYYESLQAYRPFTKDEKEIGIVLSRMLKVIQETLPGKRSSAEARKRHIE